MANIGSYFHKHGIALIPNSFPHIVRNFDDKDIKKILKEKKALFARYTSDLQLLTPPHLRSETAWWFCVKDEAVSLENLTAKQRYRVKKGLSNTTIRITNPREIDELSDAIYTAYKNSLSDYPKHYKNIQSKDSLINWIKNASENKNANIWLCRDNSTTKIIGFAHTTHWDNVVVFMSTVKIDPNYLKTEVNAALAYTICKYYLNEQGYKYVCDGERNIRHITEYQDFLVRVIGFRKAYCKLHVVYHPYIKPFVMVLYPFRRLFSILGNHSKIIYNIYCILKQEEYHRACQKG